MRNTGKSNQERTMRMATIVLCLSLLLSLSARAADPTQRTISTTGEAIVYAVPDEVTVTFGIEQFDVNLDTARDKNDQAAATLLKAIHDLGIDDKDVQATAMNVQVVYEQRNEPVLGIQGYRTDRWYSVKLEDVKLFEQLVSTALKSGANQTSGFSYDTTKLRDYRDQARVLAIRAAKEKAVALARELECEPGKPITITESDEDSSFRPMYANARGMAANLGGAFGGGGGMENTMPIGQLPIQARVDVLFELKDLNGQ
jgi:uncharacterized protein